MILLVEDNLLMRKALAETLKILEYPVIEAGNGLEALEMIDRLTRENGGHGYPELRLIMSDLTMPGMGGKELLRELKRKDIRVPFVLLSGFLEPGELDELRGMGMSGWLKKPAGIEDIAELLENVLD